MAIDMGWDDYYPPDPPKPNYSIMSQKELDRGFLQACRDLKVQDAIDYAKHGANLSSSIQTCHQDYLSALHRKINQEMDYGSKNANSERQELKDRIESYFNDVIKTSKRARPTTLGYIASNNPSLTKKMLSQHKSLFTKEILNSVLYKAIQNKQDKSIECLINYGADPNYEDKWETYDLFETVLKKQEYQDKSVIDTVNVLLKNGYKIISDQLCKHFDMDVSSFNLACTSLKRQNIDEQSCYSLYRGCILASNQEKFDILKTHWPISALSLETCKRLHEYQKNHDKSQSRISGMSLQQRLSDEQYAQFISIARTVTDNFHQKKHAEQFITAPKNIKEALKRRSKSNTLQHEIAPLFEIITRQKKPVLDKPTYRKVQAQLIKHQRPKR